jgi:PBP1b-binding outer membrane lipoprotein LpoB
MKFGLIILSLILIAGCSKQEPAASQDSLFTAPMQPAPPPQMYEDSTGLIIDSSVVRQQPDIEQLKGIAPSRVVMIYRAFQPLRTHATTSAQREAFLRAQKITSQQLHSVLAEGDRLGWGTAPQGK